MYNPKLNDRFTDVWTDCQIEISAIIVKENGVKLNESIYQFKYLNRDKKDFTCYLRDIQKNVQFKNWIKY